MCNKKKTRIVLLGLARMVFGVAIAGAYFLSICGFFITHNESGYMAVLYFLASLAAMAIAVAGSYAMGNIGNRE